MLGSESGFSERVSSRWDMNTENKARFLKRTEHDLLVDVPVPPAYFMLNSNF